MRPLRSSLSTALTAILLGLAAACHADEPQPAAIGEELPELGLMGTIPIYWGEAGDFSELLANEGPAHWARERLEAGYRLTPLDTLENESLAALDYLLLAQPRPLSPAENVALDNWVRQGGRLLLFADPMLTGESRFAIGDRRRPQDVILLSPILTHWGLELQFDEDAPEGFALAAGDGFSIPVNKPGLLAATGTQGACEIRGVGILAECAIGSGRVVVVADAAMLDLNEPHPGAPAALDRLIRDSFGESAGNRLSN